MSRATQALLDEYEPRLSGLPARFRNPITQAIDWERLTLTFDEFLDELRRPEGGEVAYIRNLGPKGVEALRRHFLLVRPSFEPRPDVSAEGSWWAQESERAS